MKTTARYLWHCAAAVLTVLMVAVATSDLRANDDRPRVFVFTDINIDAGDPDDRQSLVHLFWYADELEITGIVPDRWNAEGLEACQQAVVAYAEDYRQHGFADQGFPAPRALSGLLASDRADAMRRFKAAVEASTSKRPLHVLVWGNMRNATPALQALPDGWIPRVRLLTIGTGVLRPVDRPHLPENWERHEPCRQPNWNGAGRNELFADDRFRELWWLEMNWTYAGMFSGDEPQQMFHQLSAYGALGRHLVDVTEQHPWARYFRVGDTPSVTYLLDPENPLGDPRHGSWAGKFVRPLPVERPHFYADDPGPHPWNHDDPCETWEHAEDVAAHARSTLEARRPAMYAALLAKLERLYRSR